MDYRDIVWILIWTLHGCYMDIYGYYMDIRIVMHMEVDWGLWWISVDVDDTIIPSGIRLQKTI